MVKTQLTLTKSAFYMISRVSADQFCICSLGEFSFTQSSLHSFIQQLFTEWLLYARCYIRLDSESHSIFNFLISKKEAPINHETASNHVFWII